MKIEEAIEEISKSGLYGNQVHQETLEMALQALRAQAEVGKECIGCECEPDMPSHAACHGCARMYSDHYLGRKVVKDDG